MSFADRAVRFRERRQPTPQITNTHREISEICEESPPRPEPGFDPLDDVIAADVAAKHDRTTILARIDRCAARAALPGATAVDRQAVTDWRRILTAKDGGRGADSDPLDEEVA